MIRKKFKASFIHLLLSAIIISALISLMVIFWFPSPYLGVTNFTEIATILIIIDLILGPILTFVVFNPTKKSLRFDLSVVVAIQVMGLSYGLYMLYLTHPVYVSYYENSFNIISAEQAKPSNAKHINFKVSKLSSPTLAYVNVTDKNTKDILFTEMLDGNSEIEARTDYFEPYSDHLDDILANSLDTAKIFSKDNMDEASRKFLEKNDNINDFAFLPLVNGAVNNGILVLNKKTGHPVTMIKTSPWKYVKK